MNPLINIITRTSNRPNFFKQNYESVKGQTYKNYKHIVCYDSDVDYESYLKNYDDIDVHFIDRENLISNDKCIDPKTGPYSPHNLYFNEVYKNITDGWVIYLDDDDTFVDSNSLEKIVNFINESDDDTFIMWQMIYSNGRKLPLMVNDEIPPSIGGIGSPCFTFHSKYIPFAIWDSWKCGDFRVIDRLYKTIPKNKFTPEPIIFIPLAGFGLRKDKI